MEGAIVLRSDWLEAAGRKTPDSSKKGKRGMSVKPIGWVPAALKTSKGSKAHERMTKDTSGIWSAQ
jgi:hypothetical protein